MWVQKGESDGYGVSGYGAQGDSIGREFPLAALRSLAIFSLSHTGLMIFLSLTDVRFSLLDIFPFVTLHRQFLIGAFLIGAFLQDDRGP